MTNQLHRRSFIQLAAMAVVAPGAGAALNLSGAEPTAAAAQPAPSALSHSGAALTLKKLTADVVVVGGGMAGVCAAIAAARNGARTVLLQDRSVLGGNASGEVRMHIVGADIHGNKKGRRESGIIEELRLEDAVRNPHRSYSLWELLMYEKVTAEPNLTLLLDTACVGCVMDSGRIRSVTALRNYTEDIFEIEAQFFIDCSGDSRLAAEAGADYQIGREAQSEFNERRAVAQADRQTLSSSILFTAKKYNTPQPFIAPNWIRQFTKAELARRGLGGSGGSAARAYEYGYWWIAWGGQLDVIKDGEQIRRELLRITLGVWNYIKNSGEHPDSANWALDWVAPIPSKRESRRLRGPHLMTEQDIEAGRLFDDAVAYGGWWMDLHPPAGIDAVNQPPCVQTGGNIYTIPLRSLYSRNVPNLLFAGRNISTTHVAFSSTRVMATCAVMGQAAGTAAAQAAREHTDLAALNVSVLQQQLLKDDAYIPALKNSDPADLARRAGVSVSASSAQPDAPAAAVLDGVSRDLVGEWGDWADQRRHCWESASAPAWLELDFGGPVTVSEVRLTFDSGFARGELVLSPSDWANSHCIRGPQPETVRDYQLLADGQEVVSVTGNYLRQRAHKLSAPLTLSKLRLNVSATNGLATARVFEVRVY